MVAFGGFVVPFGLGYLIGGIIGATVEQALFIGIAMAATSLGTKSRILVDLDILDTRIAGVLLGGALLSDVGVMVVFAGVMGFVETGEVTALGLGMVAGKALLFFAAALVFGDRFLPYIWQQLEDWMNRHKFVDKTSAFTVALVVALVFAFFAALVDLHMIIGGFIAGLFLRQAQLDPDMFDRALRSVRTDEWKYIEGSDESTELYDLTEDPDETTNVAAQYPERCTEFAQLLRDRIGTLSSPSVRSDTDMNAATKKRLDDIGYF